MSTMVVSSPLGTLTEDGLDLWGVVPLRAKSVSGPVFEEPEREPKNLSQVLFNRCYL